MLPFRATIFTELGRASTKNKFVNGTSLTWLLLSCVFCGIYSWSETELHTETESDLLNLDSYIHPHQPSVQGIKFHADPKILKLAQELIQEIVTFSKEIPVIVDSVSTLPKLAVVTGVSSNHFIELMTHIKQVPKILSNETLIVYDLGLNENEIKQLQNNSFIEYRKFNFTRFPEHVRDLKTYAWKPLILQEIFRQFGAVMWMDSSIVLTRNYTYLLQRMVKFKSGVLFYLPGGGHSIVSATHPKMLQYLPMDGLEAIADEMRQGGGTIIFNTAEVLKNVLRWVVLCSLHKECIAPQGAKLFCGFYFPKDEFGGCHRYDQAMLSITVGNAYNYQTERYTLNENEYPCEIEKM